MPGIIINNNLKIFIRPSCKRLIEKCGKMSSLRGLRTNNYLKYFVYLVERLDI